MAYILTGGVDIDNLTIKKDVLGRLYVPIDNSTIKINTTTNKLYSDINTDNYSIFKNELLSNSITSIPVNLITDTQTYSSMTFLNFLSSPDTTNYFLAKSYNGNTYFKLYDYNTKNIMKNATKTNYQTITNPTYDTDGNTSTYASWSGSASAGNEYSIRLYDLGSTMTGYFYAGVWHNGGETRIYSSTDNVNWTLQIASYSCSCTKILTTRYLKWTAYSSLSGTAESRITEIALFDINNPNATITIPATSKVFKFPSGYNVNIIDFDTGASVKYIAFNFKV
jgi:hypothetical protein